MTEDEWLARGDCLQMFEYLENSQRKSERRLRLFAIACCRRAEHRIAASCQRSALDIAEQHADGLASSAELLREATSANLVAENLRMSPARVDDPVAYETDDANRHVAEAIVCAASVLSHQEDTFHRFAVNASDLLASSAGFDRTEAVYASGGTYLSQEDYGGDWSLGVDGAYIAHSAFLRDIFGNPFRPVTTESFWLTSTVVALAQQIYEERAFNRLPILADALQDAGCDNEDILAHCRSEGPHVRGCWVVDLLLGKE